MTWDRVRPGALEWLFKNYDGTCIDKGLQHTKQILAELIEPVLEFNNSIWNRTKNLNNRESQSESLSYKKGDSQCVVITKAFSLSTTCKILSNILLSCLIPYTDDITVDHLC
jgi:hypothetical protein